LALHLLEIVKEVVLETDCGEWSVLGTKQYLSWLLLAKTILRFFLLTTALQPLRASSSCWKRWNGSSLENVEGDYDSDDECAPDCIRDGIKVHVVPALIWIAGNRLLLQGLNRPGDSSTHCNPQADVFPSIGTF
jgi:hypothetical protein